MQNLENKGLFNGRTLEFDTMLSKLSHELRNPLTIIKSYLQLAIASHPDLTEDENLQIVFSEIEYVHTYLMRISELCKQASAPLNLKKASLSLLVDECVSTYSALAQEKKQALTFVTDNEVPHLLYDSIFLRQSICNLIKNAIEATDIGGKINLDLKKTPTHVELQISDTGRGIEPDQIDNIFMPFVTFKEGGTGIGLPLAQRIILHHGGSLNVTSKINVGSTFTVTLPIPIN